MAEQHVVRGREAEDSPMMGEAAHRLDPAAGSRLATTDDLVAFLLARIAEDEHFAREACQPRVLAECEAKRRIVELHSPLHDGPTGPYCLTCYSLDLAGDPVDEWPCDTARLLALPHRDHPDYKPEWAPDQQ